MSAPAPDTFAATRGMGWRRSLFFGLWGVIVALATLLFSDWLARTGMTPAKWTLTALYLVLTSGLAFGFCQAFFGCLLILTRRDTSSITRRLSLEKHTTEQPIRSRVALLFPVYNEDPVRFYNGIEASYRALEASGELEHFTFFVLSDSTRPNRWIEEETEWRALTDRLSAHGRIIYRHRIANLNQKSGNISDFCRRWGSHFDHMICFDADSLMSPECILGLVRLMEVHPQVGIIQTAPGLFGAETLFARFQQFANRIHGEISSAGLHFWQQDSGNYWGHNAIIRMKPFVEFCSLPELPGPKPLGGRVLSHDFVEAALMRKAGYEVWLAYDFEHSYEELPPTLLDFAQRDRRWCQGNLQHGWIALFGRIPLLNRVHMLNGIYAYTAAPLWLFFLGISTLAAYSWESSGLSLLTRAPSFPLSPQSLIDHGLLILGCTLALIFLPKAFTILRLLTDRRFRRGHGGFGKATLSILLEVTFFTLLAPALMLFHSSFVFSILTGDKVKWSSQNRTVAHTTWLVALKAHIGQSAVGLCWGILAWQINPMLFFWMSPVLLGWVVAIPLSVISSHTDAAEWLRQAGLLLTPEENAPPPIIQRLREEEALHREHALPISALREDYGLIQAILDPYINALHLDFLPTRRNQKAKTAEELSHLRDRLLNEGAPRLTVDEKMRLLNDRKSIHHLHRLVWTTPDEVLPPWWRLAMSRYSRQSLYVTALDERSVALDPA